MQLLHGDGRTPATTGPVVVGESPALKRVLVVAERAAGRGSRVLITGESGVGKDVIARFIHARSPRARLRFVAVNCASLTESLLESELFGHVRGSFTGAHRDKIGKLQQAHGGTIFLDEIGEMSLRMQTLMLRFLENGEFHPVGSDGVALQADVHVVAATNRDLTAMVATGHFREDLLYRIQVVHIEVPPLRERREDIRPLVEHAIGCAGGGVTIEDEAFALLEQYSWPGNVRELQNVVEQMVSLADGDSIDVAQLPPAIASRPGSRLYSRRERRRRRSDELFDALVAGELRFWDDVHTQFINRDITRADVRQLLRRALEATGGSYRTVLQLFGMGADDYKKLMNFLAAHECVVDYREFRAPRERSRSTRGSRSVAGADAAQADTVLADTVQPEPVGTE